MKTYDMIYKLRVEETRNGKKIKGVKYGCTNQHAEDRAARVEKSARKNGHDMHVRAEGYFFAPSRSREIGEAEHSIHSDRSFRHYDDSDLPFNGSTEIYSRKEERRIDRKLQKDHGIKWRKCGQ